MHSSPRDITAATSAASDTSYWKDSRHQHLDYFDKYVLYSVVARMKCNEIRDVHWSVVPGLRYAASGPPTI